MSKLEAGIGMIFESGKSYTHSVGLSCTFRQWRATHSHCRYLHGYSIQVTITFRARDLDTHNWIMDFGDLKWLKQYLGDTFDHKTLIAKDDPDIERFRKLTMGVNEPALIQLVEVDHVGCEAFAKMIYLYASNGIHTHTNGRVFVQEVEVREHEGNFARYRRDS